MAIKQVRVKVNDVWTVLTEDSDGNYTATLTAPNVTSYNVNNGHYYPITVEAVNMANVATTVDDTHSTLGSKLKLYVKEKTAPTITITAPTANQHLANARPTISFTITDEVNGSGVDITSLNITLDGKYYDNTDDGVKVTNISNGYNVQFTVPLVDALQDGTHTVKINVSDRDGNEATASGTFVTDTVAPTLAITNPATDGAYTSESNFTVTGTTSDSTSGVPTVTIKVNNTDQGTVTVSNGKFSKVVALTSGENTIVVTATDGVGKTTTITRTLILDSEAPVIASINIAPNPVNVGANYTVTVVVGG